MPSPSLKRRAQSSVIGTGLIASAFDPGAIAALGATVFASGVSNSQETGIPAFARERQLLSEALEGAGEGCFIYFSTCSVTDPHRASTPYALHKLAMEALVTTRPGFIVLRLPQVVGVTRNPNTLTNFLADRINRGLPLEVWSNATRCLIDVDTVASLTTTLIGTGRSDLLSDLAPPEIVTMPELVRMMEQALGKTAQYKLVAQGGGGITDPSLAVSMSMQAGENLEPGYTLRTIQKYYGNRHAG